MTTRFSLVLLFVLALSACDSFSPTDEPLPTRAQLLADFGRQVPYIGTGYASERGGNAHGSYSVTARYTVYGAESPYPDGRNLHVSLRPADGSAGSVGLQRQGVWPSEVRVGDELGVSVSGPSSRGSGSGMLYITAVDGEAISGVFAADTQSTGNLFSANYRRVTGTFTAHPDSTI